MDHDQVRHGPRPSDANRSSTVPARAHGASRLLNRAFPRTRSDRMPRSTSIFLCTTHPQYLILNQGISQNFGTPNWKKLQFPTVMKVDYVRV